MQQKYLELWQSARPATQRYLRLWQNQLVATPSGTIDDLIAAFPNSADDLKAMRADGVTLELKKTAAGDLTYLVTSDPDVAKKYDMHDESEFWGAE